MSKIESITIDGISYPLQKVDIHNMITGKRYIFHGISWYEIVGYNHHNHIEK